MHDIPVVAFVDPDMMSSMPKGLTASTGMDALTHAIEGYTTLGAWAVSYTHLDVYKRQGLHSLKGTVSRDSPANVIDQMPQGTPCLLYTSRCV